MITVKLKQVVAVSEAGAYTLHPGIFAVLHAKRLPVKAMYQLSRIGKRLSDEAARFSEVRFALIKEYGAEVLQDYEVEEGGQKVKKQRPTGAWAVSQEKVGEFLEKQKELFDTEVEINLNPVKISELGEQVEGITPADLAACEAFIVEG